jgi:hypothetical protein
MEVQRPGTILSLSLGLALGLRRSGCVVVCGVWVYASRSRRTVPDFVCVCGGEDERKGGNHNIFGGKRFLGLFGSRARSGFMIRLKSDRVMGPLTDSRSQI